MQIGILYESKGNIELATQKYQKADKLYEEQLESFDQKDDMYYFILVEKANYLILLGREKEGRSILQKLIDNNYGGNIIFYERYLNLSRQELIESRL